MIWTIASPADPAMLGLIPAFLNSGRPEPAREQLHAHYAHGGGWHPFDGFELHGEGVNMELRYPGDRPMRVLGFTKLRSETIAVFEYSWVAVIAADGSYEIARMD